MHNFDETKHDRVINKFDFFRSETKIFATLNRKNPKVTMQPSTMCYSIDELPRIPRLFIFLTSTQYFSVKPNIVKKLSFALLTARVLNLYDAYYTFLFLSLRQPRKWKLLVHYLEIYFKLIPIGQFLFRRYDIQTPCNLVLYKI